MNNWIETQYLYLLEEIVENGIIKTDRTGTGTKSIFGRQIRHKMSEGFPLLTTKKMAWKTMVTELLWFLRGDTNIKYLVDNGCNIWNGDAYKNYLKVHSECVDGLETQEEFIKKIKTDEEFAEKWGELGPIYGAQWRAWGKREGTSQDSYYSYKGIDQIRNLINELKTNPDSRRLMVNAWNVDELHNMVLPPCHYGFQIYTRELTLDERFTYWFNNNNPNRWVVDGFDQLNKELQHEFLSERNTPTRAISLMWNQRSVDTFLGLPFNIASYALLLEIIAKEVNMIPDELIGNLGDCHLYLNHIEQAKEQLNRDPYDLPVLSINDEFWHPQVSIMEQIKYAQPSDFNVLKYNSWNSIKAPLNN